MDLSVRPEPPIRVGEFEIVDVAPGRVTGEVASDVMLVQYQAYATRFPEVRSRRMKEALEADISKPHHIDNTHENLLKGPLEHWYWSVALERDARLGRMAVVAWALCTVEDERINVLDVYTRPDRQQRGLGSAALLLALRNAADDDQIIDRPYDQLRVRLHVARRSRDEDLWPTSWYRGIGFRDTGDVSPNQLTFDDPDFRLDRFRMEGDYVAIAGALTQNLQSRGVDLTRFLS